MERYESEQESLANLQNFVENRSKTIVEHERQLIDTIENTVGKIKEIRQCPKVKNVVLGYLEKKKVSVPRFSPKPLPWYDYYQDLQRFNSPSPRQQSYY